MDFLRWGINPWGQQILTHISWDLLWASIFAGIMFFVAHASYMVLSAHRKRSEAEVDAMGGYRCPRVLADAYSAAASGGTGLRVPSGIIMRIRAERPLWIAGGIGPDNIAEVLRDFSPELIDASSRLEESSGRKDRNKLKAFFTEIQRHAEVQ